LESKSSPGYIFETEMDLDCSQSLLSLCSAAEDSEPPGNTPPAHQPGNPLPFSGEITTIKHEPAIARKPKREDTLKPPTPPDRVGNCKRCNNSVHYDQVAGSCKTEGEIIVTPLPFDQFFLIEWCPACKTETEGRPMNIQLLPRQWADIAKITLQNLKNINNEKESFMFREEICSFVKKHWDQLCIGKSRDTNWRASLGSAMNVQPIFGCHKIASSNSWYLKKESEIEAPQKSSRKRKRSGSKDRGSKRPKTKMTDESQIEYAPEPLVDPYVYIPLPPKFYSPHPAIPLVMRLEKENSAPQIQISNSGLECSNASGYRMARASFPVIEPGVYYYEVTLPRNAEGNIRLGWSTEKGDLQGPVGYDKYSYSYRSKTGQRFWRARGKSYGESFGGGDTIGCLLKCTDQIEERVIEPDLPKLRKQKNEKWKKEVAIYSKKSDDSIPQEVMVGSEIQFFKNGQCQGVAYQDILKGNYYPAVSLFKNAECTCNFGPKAFAYPVPRDHPHADTLLPVCAVVPAEHPKPPPDPIPPTPVVPAISPFPTTPASPPSQDQPTQEKPLPSTSLHSPLTQSPSAQPMELSPPQSIRTQPPQPTLSAPTQPSSVHSTPPTLSAQSMFQTSPLSSLSTQSTQQPTQSTQSTQPTQPSQPTQFAQAQPILSMPSVTQGATQHSTQETQSTFSMRIQPTLSALTRPTTVQSTPQTQPMQPMQTEQQTQPTLVQSNHPISAQSMQTAIMTQNMQSTQPILSMDPPQGKGLAQPVQQQETPQVQPSSPIPQKSEMRSSLALLLHPDVIESVEEKQQPEKEENQTRRFSLEHILGPMTD